MGSKRVGQTWNINSDHPYLPTYAHSPSDIPSSNVDACIEIGIERDLPGELDLESNRARTNR